jgi:hypothetical protein
MQLTNISPQAGNDPLRQLLSKWICLNEEYAESWDFNDFPWFYGERAATGLLATAAWMSGGIALEEYRTKKMRTRYSTKQKKYTGRCDLCMRLERNDYICEAKHFEADLNTFGKTFTWLNAKNGSKLLKDISEHLETESTAAKRNSRPGEIPIGIVFVSFRYSFEKIADEKLAAAIFETHYALRSTTTKLATAMGWWFDGGKAIAGKLQDNYQAYPGFAVFIRKLPKR